MIPNKSIVKYKMCDIGFILNYVFRLNDLNDWEVFATKIFGFSY